MPGGTQLAGANFVTEFRSNAPLSVPNGVIQVSPTDVVSDTPADGRPINTPAGVDDFGRGLRGQVSTIGPDQASKPTGEAGGRFATNA